MNGTEKPCLVETPQGFTVLYKNQYLYSRHEPAKTIRNYISALKIQPGTLLLCISPAFGYGLQELFDRLPDHCFVLAVEHERALYDFSAQYLKKYSARTDFASVYIPDEYFFCSLFLSDRQNNPLPPAGIFKRCISIDFSAGIRLHKDLYGRIITYANDFISQFWKNRLTLIKMGRLYARNLFRNLASLPFAKILQPQSISKPILVLGAGCSIDAILPILKKHTSEFFILAVDSALNALLCSGINPDAAVAVECQLANEKAFIGTKKNNIPLIADITSRPNITRLSEGNTYFFMSEYTRAFFLDRLQAEKLIQPVFPPLGSVGLAAMEIALYLRMPDIPVFFAGLDFCFPAGSTHCKEAPASKYALNTAMRTKPAGQPDSAFKTGASKIVCKNGTVQFTDNALANYAALFSARYSSQNNIFDIAAAGTDLHLRRCTPQNMLQFAEAFRRTEIQPRKNTDVSLTEQKKTTDKIISFYEQELSALQRIRLILSGETKTDNSFTDAKNELEKLLSEREYLYLHFPDAAAGLKTETSFLKRIRAEIDFFIKDINVGISALRG